MPNNFVIIVTGPPCSGKTTLGQRLADDLRLPFLSKDRIKETLFDTLGWSDREWSRKLGAATMELLYTLVEMELSANRSFLVECNFSAELATARFLKLKQKYSFETCQVLCDAEDGALIERVKQRVKSGERHPGHVERLMYEEIASSLLDGRYAPLNIGGSVLRLDTTDFSRVDYPGLLEAVSRQPSAVSR